MKHFDALETRDPAVRETAQFEQLQVQLRHLQAHTRYGAEQLAGLDTRCVHGRADLARLPLLRKRDIAARQAASRASDPLGGLAAVGWGAIAPNGARAAKVFQSPGPIYEPEAATPDPWRIARALWAARFRAGDLVHNSFSYHLTPAGSMMESGCLALGCTVLPAGVGATEQQLQAIHDLQPAAYCGTPSFLRILLEKGASSFKKALVSGEAFPVALRDWCFEQGVLAYQAYATADCGLIAYETEAREGLVVDEGVIVELVQPGTGTPVAEGEVGEVVVTRLDSAYPLLRYATGDLSAALPGASPCGRTNQRLRGWLGRADQSAKVRGLFVHEAQFNQLRMRFPGLKLRWVVEGEMANDRFTVEVEGAPDEGLATQLQDATRELTKLRAEARFVTQLPADGRVIEDRRVV
ncbi:phenylacetate--CoA ligase family protein [Inhella sp.]|uniref:phenylacetate--CoA ligase family protein n=1 Tax=Inhella sp. TaxID=1921806 RepID=UPI0035ADE002